MITQYPDVRVYSSTGARRAFPVDQVSEVQWQHLALGGFGQCTVAFNDKFDGVMPMAAGDRFEVWVAGTMRYRGYMGVAQIDLNLTGQKSLTVYGMAERMNGIIANKRYLSQRAQSADDVAEFIYNDFVAPVYVDAVTSFGSCPAQVYDFSASSNVRSSLDSLNEASGNTLVWGWQVSNVAGSVGKDQFYVLAKSTTPKYKFVIGGNVKAFSMPTDHTSIVNAVHFYGGEMPFPNLLPDPRFDKLDIASETCGNMLANESFEDYMSGQFNGWTKSSVTAETDNVRTGRYSWAVTANNGYIEQINIPVQEARTYNFSIFVYNVSGFTFQIRFTAYDESSNSVVSDVVTVASGASEQTNAWNKHTCSWESPLGAVTVALRITVTSGSGTGLRMDDVALWDSHGIGSTGWKVSTAAGASFYLGNAIFGDPSAQGYRDNGHCAKIILPTLAPGNLSRQEIGIPQEQRISVTSSKKLKPCYKAACAYKASAGAATVSLIMRCYFAGAVPQDIAPTDVFDYIGEDPGWHYTGWIYAQPVPANCTSVRLIISVSSTDGVAKVVYLDSAQFFEDSNHVFDLPYGVAVPAYHKDANYECWLRTSDSFIQDDSTLSAALKTSIATYGEKQAEETDSNVTSDAAAQAWARNYFLKRALPQSSWKLEIAGCTQDVRCDGAIEVLGSSQEPAWPISITHKLRPGADSTDMSAELGAVRPSFEGLLQQILRESQKQAALKSLR